MLAQDDLKLLSCNDDMGTTNPWRGHGAAHKVGVGILIFLDLPLRFNTAFPNVHLF